MGPVLGYRVVVELPGLLLSLVETAGAVPGVLKSTVQVLWKLEFRTVCQEL